MGVTLATRAGVPLIPVAVRTDFLQLGRLHKDLVSVHGRRPVRLACGDPIPPDQPPQAMQAAATGFVTTTLSAWESETGTPLLAAPPSRVTVERAHQRPPRAALPAPSAADFAPWSAAV